MENAYLYNLGLLFNSVTKRFNVRTVLRYHGGNSYSYAQLDERSGFYAKYLYSKGLRKGNVVALFNDKSFEALSLMLACIRSGVIYTNLDAENPWQRISKILDTCKPDLIFNGFEEFRLREEIQTIYSDRLIDLFSIRFNDPDMINYPGLESICNDITGTDPVYIMFTSGSTGFPKGAVMSHDNVLNFISWAQNTFQINENDVLTNANPIYFDNSVFDFYSSIFSGACMVPMKTEEVKDGKLLVKIVSENNCTFWFSVPSLLIYLLTTKSIGESDFHSLRAIAFGGEGFSKVKLKQLFDLYSRRIKLYNVYGPTECTCICSSYLINESDFKNMNELAPLGKMAANFGWKILNADNTGVGELALCGPNVGLGYYNDLERTSKSFVQEVQLGYLNRYYKTGDLVEKRNDGLIYFKGRVDNQIKHMGYRIELEEVEAAINTLGYVNETAVVYRKLSADLGMIVAYVCLNEPDKFNNIDVDLQKLLPGYMLPKKVITMDKLPKNRNGKIDRTQLN